MTFLYNEQVVKRLIYKGGDILLKSKKFLMIVLALVLVLGGVGGGYYYLNGAKLGYLKAESKGLETVLTTLASYQGDLGKSLEMYNTPLTTQQELTLGLESKQMNEQTQMIAQILKMSKVKVESFQDMKNNQNYLKATITPVGAQPVVMESFSDKDKSGYGVPAFYNKYLYANTADQEKINKELGQTIPSGTINPNELVSALTVNKAEVESIGKEYAKIYADSITRKQVEAKSTEEGQQYTVNFDDQQGEQFLTKFTTALKSDDKLVDLIFTHYEKITKVYKNAGASLEKPQTKETIKKEIVDYADSLIRDLDKKDNSLRMLIIVDKNGNIVQRNMSSSNNSPEDTDIVKIFNNSALDAPDIRVLVETSDKETSVNERFDFNFTLKPEGDRKKGAVTVLSKSTSKENPQDSEVTVNFTTTHKDKTQKLDSTILVKSTKKGVAQTFKGGFTFNLEETGDKTASFDYAVNADLNAQTMPDLKLVLSGKGGYEVGKTMTLPTVNETNAVNLGTITKADMEKIQEELGQGFGNYIMNNPVILQSVLASMLS